MASLRPLEAYVLGILTCILFLSLIAFLEAVLNDRRKKRG